MQRQCDREKSQLLFTRGERRKHSLNQHGRFCSPSLTPLPYGEQGGLAGLEQGQIPAEMVRALSCSWRHLVKADVCTLCPFS